MTVDPEEMARLIFLRRAFLAGDVSPWRDEADLAAYDTWVAPRHGWRWRAILEELRARRVLPPLRTVLDYGCGTGIAGRSVGAVLGPVTRHVVDRSKLAVDFTVKRGALPWDGQAVDALVVGHVLPELKDPSALLALAATVPVVLWVEPGDARTSRALVAVREALRATHTPVGPCTHAGPCPLADARDWCHHIAQPPPEIRADPRWQAMARTVGIDLRAAPFSWLALVRGGTVDSGISRILGRPRSEKGRTLYDVCSDEGHRVATHRWRDGASRHPAPPGRYLIGWSGDRVGTMTPVIQPTTPRVEPSEA